MSIGDGLDWPYNRIPDWLFPNANEGTVEPKFLDGVKNMKAAYRQQLIVNIKLNLFSRGLHERQEIFTLLRGYYPD